VTKLFRRVAAPTALALFLTASAHADPLQLVRMTPDELTWRPTWTGAEFAIVAGDLQKAGVYVIRLRFPAGFRNPPHFHPDERIVTILSGTLLVGYGEQFDESTMKALPAGSVFTEPVKQPHFAWARDTEVIVQVVGHGPSATTWLSKTRGGP
jgi:quercetin dioxygenase-like cupin family protein